MARETSRFGLSDISFLPTDPQTVLTEIVTKYCEASGRTLAEGDPVYLFLETIAAVIVSLRNEVDQAAKEALLGYATGGFLDAGGIMVGTTRRKACGASVTLKFTLNTALEASYQIPQGTLVTNGTYVFATDEMLVIPAGETEGTVSATATVTGTAANGIAADTLNILSTPLPGLSVTNTAASAGGADDEKDDDFAERIALAPEAFSCAGPAGAYRYHALAAHADIADVSITTPTPGTVDVRPILKNGELPTEEILELVRKALNDDSVRPLTDTVIVASPEPEYYTIDVEWTLAKADEPLLATITAQVAAAVEEYRLWQRTMPGRDINPAQLTHLLVKAGARYVKVNSPDFKALTPTKIAIETSVNVSYTGAKDE